MDEQQRRIADDLAGLFQGELRFDRLTRSIYATDASLYQVLPLGVAFPRHEEDVVLLATYAAEQQIPLTARGAGTGVAGGAVGSGLIVDFSRHLNAIEAIGDDTVRVQAGVVHQQLNMVLKPLGRCFAPDPAGSATTTIGSMIAVDAAGSHAVRIGSTRDHVVSIATVLAGGELFEAGSESLAVPVHRPASLTLPTTNRPEKTEATKWRIVSRLAALLRDHRDLIGERQPPMVRNCCGYHLRTVLTGETLELPRLLVGSEGTLGLFTSATLHTAPLPKFRGVVLLLFGRLEAAARTAAAISDQQPSACDLLDRRLLTLAREEDPRFSRLIDGAAEAALLVEQTGFNERQVWDRLRMLTTKVRHVEPSVHIAAETTDEAEIAFLWSLPQRVVPLLTRLKGPTRPLPFVEDIAVPPLVLNDFLVRVQRVFQRHNVTATLYAHAASGQLHLRPFLLPPAHADAKQIEAISRDVYAAVFALGGTITGEHGDGLSRTAFIRSQYGPLYRLFREVKDIFDPHNLLNPGKIVSDDPHLTIRHLRPRVEPEVTPLQLHWDIGDLAAEAVRCNSCGVCRTQEEGLRMCPFFREDQIEEASPRSKANAMRNLATGTLNPDDMASPEMKRLADLCFNCKQCRLECPTQVDIPRLMIEAKAQHVATHGTTRADWILSRAHSFGEIGCLLAPIANRMLGNPAARWLLEKTVGLARRRKLPTFARRTFLRTQMQQRRRRPVAADADRRPVVYFVDHFANYHDPELARAFLAILKHNNIAVHVPAGQTASGMAMISAGELDIARELATQNVLELSEYAREGYTIVCTEPAAALCLSQEYPSMLDHPDVEMVAAQVREAGAYLGALHEEGRLRTDFQPLNFTAVYHTPCHLKAICETTPLADLLGLIPDLRLRRIEEGCSGMAGAFGLTRDNFELSLQIGHGLMQQVRHSGAQIGVTECSSCKIQMEQGCRTPTIHPIKLLALAYGLMPELRRSLQPVANPLVVS